MLQSKRRRILSCNFQRPNLHWGGMPVECKGLFVYVSCGVLMEFPGWNNFNLELAGLGKEILIGNCDVNNPMTGPLI